MLALLWRISVPEFRKHFLRFALTLVGIILGVAIFSAVRSANYSLRSALNDTIDSLAGKAVLQVTAGQAGLPEETVDRVRSVAGVRAAVPVIEAVVRTADASQGNILILGVDMAGDQSMRDYRIEGDEEAISDPLVFLAQPDSLLVAREFADRNALEEDSRIELRTALGTKTFTVRGIMAPRGMATAFGGNVAVMDIYSAQFVFSRGLTFDRVDVALEEGLKVDDVLPRIEEELGPGFKVEPPARRGRQTESLMEAFSQGLFFSSIIALMVGLFLIFNAFSVSVAQRRTQIGILRALGVTRRQIHLLFLAESLLLGALGAALGVVAGLLLGRGLMVFMATVVEQTYGVQVHVDNLYVDPNWTVLSFGMGVAASVVGAGLPARAAGRVDPALALQKGKYQALFLGENRMRRIAGLILLIVSLTVGFSPWVHGIRAHVVVFAVLFISLGLLAPTFSHYLAELLRRPMFLLFGMEGRLASDSLVQAPRRTSATVAALMFSLTFVLIMATFNSSVRASILKWMDFAINSDLFVSAAASMTVRNFQFPASMGEELKEVPGVRQVESVRILTLDYGDSAPMLASIEMDLYLKRATPMMEQGRIEDLLPGMQGKKGALISNNFARMHNLRTGSRFFLDTPTGRHEFTVVGVQVDYSSDNGSLLIDREVYKELWSDDRVDTFDLMLAPGYSPAEVKAAIQRRFSESRQVFVMTNQDMRGELLRITDQFFAFQYSQLLVAVVVAVLGIINSLMVSITERRREIGILRGLGAGRGQVRKAILLEAVCIGMVAVLLGTVSGAITGYYVVGSFGASFNGWVFPYEFPVGMALALIPGVAAVSVVAAWYPASLALRTRIVDALAYE